MFRLNSLCALVCMVMLFACNTTNNKSLLIKFSPDSTSILISNIDPVGLLQLKNNINTDTMYQKLVTVLITPSDDDSLTIEKEWPGGLSMKGNELEFKPDSPFVKGKSYLVSTMLNASFGSVEEIIKGQMGTSLNAQEQVLKR